MANHRHAIATGNIGKRLHESASVPVDNGCTIEIGLSGAVRVAMLSLTAVCC